jgi:tetratricopeptide (TPR) repeat protein
MTRDPLHVWRLGGVVATLVIIAAVPLRLIREQAVEPMVRCTEKTPARFVGRSACRECHETAFRRWMGSDHDDAMDIADETTVRGDFDDAVHTEKGVTSRFFKEDGRFMVNTEGPDGKNTNFEIAYTFGVWPLQQYLIEFPGGRLQTLNVSWDDEDRRWFTQYPNQEIPTGDWLHWTRNGRNWNGMCAECHSTNLKKNYDPDTDTYDTTWSEIDVSCEACHGPASRHVAWARTEPMARPPLNNYGLVVKTKGLDAKQQVELCAPCHSRRSELGDYDHQDRALLDDFVPTLLEENLYYADGQILDEVYVWGSFTQSKMYKNGVKCSDCHDVHSLKHHVSGNGLCLQCHRKDVYDTKAHHFHKKVYQGRPSDGARCIKCHMPESPYMVIDDRADHSLRIPRPDLSKAIGAPNACNQKGCHADKSVDWSIEAFTKWYGKARKPHYGTVFAAARKHFSSAQKELWNIADDPLFPPIVRATALSLLTSYSDDHTLDVFERALADEEGFVRHAAIRYLPGSRDVKRLVEIVSPLLFDPLKAVRTQAAIVLADAPKDLLEPYQHDTLKDDLAEYEAAMAYSLDFSASGHNLGNLYTRLGKPDKAEVYYRRAIAVDDLFFPAKVNLAMLLNGQGRNKEAKKLLEEVVAAYPEEYKVHYSLGLLLGEMGKYEEAAAHLVETLKGLPDHEGAKRNLKAVREYLDKTKR